MRKVVKKGQDEQLKAQLARALADYDNLRKRTEMERGEFEKITSLGLILKLLSVLDILELAQTHLNDHGLGLAVSEFKRVFAEEGLTEIRPNQNEAFDPKIHEAVESVHGGKKGKVAGLVLPGWKFEDGKVIRVAKVKVYGEKTQKEEELEKEIMRGDYV
ncbi:nucleotide exchange factor GrpE [Candidatus Woesebacteria bacterium]|nr:nucleotide exchange factor GrpE [Candidatus Woesebacteria bacterium]